MSIYLLAAIFFAIALLYSTVGFGGGSSYIAALLLVGLSVSEVRVLALSCNIIVVSTAAYQYHKSGLIPWKEIWPILVLSIPMAFVGGLVELSSAVFRVTAAVLLLIAAGLMVKDLRKVNYKLTVSPVSLGTIGGSIGFASGIIGIGGGIFLAPLLHLIKWQSVVAISATASIFILANSLSGMAGQLVSGVTIPWKSIAILGTAVFIGGRLGNYLNINKLRPRTIKLLTAILVGYVGLRILILYLTTV